MPRKTRGSTSAPIVRVARKLREGQTPAETILWNALRGGRLAGLKFRRQHPFGPFVLDMFCVEHQLALEVDGRVHLIPTQAQRDQARTQFLNARGVRVLRFSNDQVEHQLEQVLKRIIEATRIVSRSGDDL